MLSCTDDEAKADALNFRTGCWIDGAFFPSPSGETFPSINPATGGTLCDAAKSGAADVDRALVSTRTAFEDGRWSGKTAPERKEVLLKRAGLIRKNLAELVLLDTLNVGTVSVNTGDAVSPMTPFGGMKQSGFGRELSIHSFDRYAALKTVWVKD